MGHNLNFKTCPLQKKFTMNLPKLFNKNIYEMIDTFIKTITIFKPLYFKDFMDINDAMYTPTARELKFAIGGQGPLVHEAWDAKSMYTTYNIGGNLMSHVTPNPSTPIVSISYNETTHHNFFLCSQLSPKVTNKNYHEHKVTKTKGCPRSIKLK
jgi:hypothetical protein